MKISIGKQQENKPVSIDLDLLLKTRLLIQASSGGGKSWAMRRMAEQLFGQVQIIIIDPEGEFASLRDKFGFVLVGKDGETPAQSASASKLAETLLRLDASAICDLYELPPHERHLWVRNFCEGMINAPKELWKPVVVFFDEAHIFAPEKGHGESVASGAVIDMATRGRKRGFCSVFATQRLGKLSKNVAAETQNVMIGMTFIDLDVDRAVEALGVLNKDKKEVAADLKRFRPGEFFVFGRAFETFDRLRMTTGGVKTSDAQDYARTTGGMTPPTPESVKKFLKPLEEIPIQIEKEKQTLGDLQDALSRERDLRIKAEADLEIEKQIEKGIPASAVEALGSIKLRLDGVLSDLRSEITEVSDSIGTLVGSTAAPKDHVLPLRIIAPSPVAESSPVQTAASPVSDIPESERKEIESLSACQKAVLSTLMWKHGGLSIDKIALLSLYKNSGNFMNNFYGLRSAGLIATRGSIHFITSEGTARAKEEGVSPRRNDKHIFDHWHSDASGCGKGIMNVLAVAGNSSRSCKEVAESAGYGVNGNFMNNVYSLRKAGVIQGGASSLSLAPELLVSYRAGA